MEPKDKALQILKEIELITSIFTIVKKLGLAQVDNILNVIDSKNIHLRRYWQEVREEIQKIQEL